LTVGILLRQQLGAPALERDARPRRLPLGRRCAGQIAFDLPADRRVGVEQPRENLGVNGHAGTLPEASDSRYSAAVGG